MVLVLYLIGSEGGARYHGPITDRRKAKPKPFPGTFDSYFKIALYGPKITFGLIYEMTNLPFVFSKYQTTLLHEIYTACCGKRTSRLDEIPRKS